MGNALIPTIISFHLPLSITHEMYAMEVHDSPALIKLYINELRNRNLHIQYLLEQWLEVNQVKLVNYMSFVFQSTPSTVYAWAYKFPWWLVLL